MTAPAPVAERLDALAERAADEIRSPELRRLFRDLLAVVGEIGARPVATGTGLTPEQLEAAIGGVRFLATFRDTLAAVRAETEAADRANIDRVLRALFHDPAPAP